MPFADKVDDIWLPLSTTRTIATSLCLIPEPDSGTKHGPLSALLDWSTRLAWSLDDGEEGGMLHNWKIPSEFVETGSYSSTAMQRYALALSSILNNLFAMGSEKLTERPGCAAPSSAG